MSQSRSEGLEPSGWGNLPPHLSQALTEALEGLREAYLDVNHPMIPQMQALWAVADEIERELLSEHRE